MWSETSHHGSSARLGVSLGGISLIVLAFAYVLVVHDRLIQSPQSPPSAQPPGALVWPDQGQAALLVDGWSGPEASPDQRPAPIASIAKLMTAYLVLRHHPLARDEDGPTLRVAQSDVDDTAKRAAQDQSIIAVESGEQLTERQALEAILIPSANNVATMLARWVSGSIAGFVAQMNATAKSWQLASTRYTDPSGFDPATVSTASEQLIVVRHVMGLPVLAQIVAMPSVWLPLAGVVRSTDALLGRDGVVGVKTGSDDAAGGCFAFQASRLVAGRRLTVVGVVLGQRGSGGPLPAAFRSTTSLLTSVVG